jgi:hypothetical protein
MKTKLIALLFGAACILSAETLETKYAGYTSDLKTTITAQWIKILDESRVTPPKNSAAQITFTLNSRGEADIIRVNDADSGKHGVWIAQQAISEAMPLHHWTDAMIKDLDESVTGVATFTYSKPLRVTLKINYTASSGSVETNPARTVDQLEADLRATREKYLGEHPELPTILASNIREGKLLAGMSWEQSQVALGHLSFGAKSEGVGGTFESWSGRDKYFRYTLYFADGRLARWTTASLY